jgi:hypothetical protein
MACHSKILGMHKKKYGQNILRLYVQSLKNSVCLLTWRQSCITVSYTTLKPDITNTYMIFIKVNRGLKSKNLIHPHSRLI